MTGLGPEPAGVCFHCGLPIPRGISFSAEIGGERRPVCCAGCRAVAELIAGSGLGAYYERREGYARTPEPEDGADQAFLDEPAFQREFVRSDGDVREATLLVDGIRCAACAWLIDRHLGGQPGVESARVGLATRRLVIRWRADAIRLSTICAELGRLGYGASPFLADAHDAQLRAEDRRALRRLGVAGLGTMQVMMLAVGLYAGAGTEPTYRDLLRFASFIVATVVVVYAARPFFEGALRDLRSGAPGMDVPVALAIGFAYAASSVATFRGAGEVYFDSACMFTFFLGLGRHAELRARRRSDERIRTLLHGIPETACRLEGLEATREAIVPARALEVGDTVLVRPGAIVPADGRVLEGESAANEALLTGEAAPQVKAPGDLVIGGSQNIDAPLVVRVERVGADGTASRIAALLERAQLERPPAVRAADRIARVFVSCVIAVAAVVGVAWWQMAPQDAPWVVLAVLVATCPCALSLATPAALASATNALARVGFLVTRGHVLETLARATHVVFDKTGTVTQAEPALARVVPLRGDPPEEIIALASLLERGSAHPVATALRAHAAREPHVRQAGERLRAQVEDCDVAANRGVAGSFRGRRVRVGRPDWAARVCEGEGQASPEPPEGRASWVLVADARGPVAWLGFESAIRPDAAAVTRWLGEEGIAGLLLSGDPSGAAVADVARALGLQRFESGATPERKVDVVEQLQAEGAVVAAVGDGVNDAPCMGRAQVSVAMGSGTDLTRLSADAILLSDRVDALRTAIRHAHRTRQVVRQNLTWAVLYNLCALPLAAAGFVQPWMAAVGMSASSLLVVANALRLGRLPSDTGSAPVPADGATAAAARLRGAEAAAR